MAGLTDQGFEPKPLADIQTDLGSGFRAVFGAAITLIAQSVFGQIIGVISERLADLWQLGLSLYTASTREGAVGIQLDHIGALTGTYRLPATNTHVFVQCNGTDGTVITAGSLVSIPGVGTQFTTDADSVPMSGGTGVQVNFRAVNTGPFAAPSGTVTHIDTPISGWTSCSNPLDEFALGTNIESDTAYRLRQVAELRAIGSSTVAAIRAAMFAVSGVTDAFVFSNDSDITDSNGLTPHTFECVVNGGDDGDVASVVSLQKPVGTGTHGTSAVATSDANGFPLTVNFSRPVDVPIYIIVNIIALASTFPSNGATLVQDAIVSYEVNYHVGSEVRSSALVPNIFAATAGILECQLPLIGIAASPSTSTSLVMTNHQIADLDTSRTIVNVTLV